MVEEIGTAELILQYGETEALFKKMRLSLLSVLHFKRTSVAHLDLRPYKCLWLRRHCQAHFCREYSIQGVSFTGQHAFSTRLETHRLLTAHMQKILQTERTEMHLSKLQCPKHHTGF